MPIFESKEHILWLNPPEFRSTADGASPLSRYNSQSYENKECLIHKLILKKESTTVTFEVKQNRNSGFLERRASCIGGKSSVYEAFYLNSQYMAFNTSEPGWIFFDYKNAKFLPFIINTNPNHISNLFATKSGKILIEIQPNTQVKTKSTGIDKEANGLREIIVNSQRLEAPLNTNDFVKVKKIQKENKCIIERKNNRSCN